MVDGDDRFFPYGRKGSCRFYADRQRNHEAGTHGHGEGVEVRNYEFGIMNYRSFFCSSFLILYF